jgi:RNA polymerase sigma factor (sigma-70 family)
MKPEDQQLLVSVLAEWRQPLVRYAWRLVRDVELAEDLVREAALRLLRRPPRNRTPRAFGAFLFKAIKRLGIDELRRRESGAKAHEVAEKRARRGASTRERDDTVFEQAARADTLRAVAARLPALTELERRAFALVRLEHHTTAKAAVRLGTSTKSIDRALRRANHKLGAILAATSDPPVAELDLTKFPEGPSGVLRPSMEVADIDHVTPRDDESAA